MSPRRPRHSPEESPDDYLSAVQLLMSGRLKAFFNRCLEGENPPVNPVDLGRRRFLRGFGAATGLAAAIGIGAVVLSPEEQAAEQKGPESTPAAPEACHRTIHFFGQDIEIQDEAEFAVRLDEAMQSLLLKFSERQMVDEPLTTKDPNDKRLEINEEFWPRALQEDFRNVLVQMERYEPFIGDVAKSMGLHPDVISFFGIEAGFNASKRSHTGFCGIGQVGLEAVEEATSEIPAEYAEYVIPQSAMNKPGDWHDLRYDPARGIVNGVAYIAHLQKEIPETVNDLFKKFRGTIQRWLESPSDASDDAATTQRIDTIEVQLELPVLNADMRARTERVMEVILEGKQIELNQASFAVPAYNMGAAGVARLVFLNYLDAKVRGDHLLTEQRLSVFHLNPDFKAAADAKDKSTEEVEDTDTITDTITGYDMDLGRPVQPTDSAIARKERDTYLWQAYAFHVLAKKWKATPPGEFMEIPFKGTTYRLQRPAELAVDYRVELQQLDLVDVEVPVGLDLIHLAEVLHPNEKNPYDTFRLQGNGGFVRGGAYYGNPKNQKFQEGTVVIQIPRQKKAAVDAYLANNPVKVHLHRIKAGETAGGILQKVKKNNPSLPKDAVSGARVFWKYNRMGEHRLPNIFPDDRIVLPGDIASLE